MEGITTIIWDWNGTLLNDTDICIESINSLLKARDLPLLTLEKYHSAFGFPIIDYYRRIGFDFCKEPFEVPAMEYIHLYTQKVKESRLHEAACDVLEFFEKRNMRQIVLSASEIGILESSITYFGIRDFFSDLAGLDNHYAVSKTEIGRNLLQQNGIRAEQACLIGDTTHDYDVAREIGCRCILVADGHQPTHRLRETGCLVVEKLEEVKGYFGVSAF